MDLDLLGRWFRTQDRRPPPGQNVLTWRVGQPGWGHGHYDLDYGWLCGCECFRCEPPDYWMIPNLPDSANGNET